jgi:PBP1b-binding outer membrane lipoprotein LpoB
MQSGKSFLARIKKANKKGEKSMTKKILVIFAIALIALCCVASAAPYRDYDMKYSDPNAPYNVSDSATTGALYIDVLCGHNLFSKEVVIQRVN